MKGLGLISGIIEGAKEKTSGVAEKVIDGTTRIAQDGNSPSEST